MVNFIRKPDISDQENTSFPLAVVEVPTAIPAFIGYTEKASFEGKSMINQPTRITSLSEYLDIFGGGFYPKFKLDDVLKEDDQILKIGRLEKAIKYVDNNNLMFFNSIRLFFSNGGGTCYIVSVGTFQGRDSLQVKKDQLLGTSKDEYGKVIEGGLSRLEKVHEPTMIIIPEAVLLGEECYEVYNQVLFHCGKLQNRIAILDVYNGFNSRTNGDKDNILTFREIINSKYLSYAAAYFPWLDTDIVQKDEVTFRNLDAGVDLGEILPELTAKMLITSFPKCENEFKVSLAEERPDIIITDDLLKSYIQNKNKIHHVGLEATSPTYVAILDKIRTMMNLLPAAPAMAGIYTMVDNSRGVWKSPANVSLNSVFKPSVNITHDQQEDLNVNFSGKSINAIRTFPGVGSLVWGGKTLDGNSLDWRYINVRRTMIMLEQSMKSAISAFESEPNNSNTWINVKSTIANYLNQKWKQGALAGASPEDAFEVQVGLGATMTDIDILEGKMLVSVKVAISRPVEFIVVIFEQKMQKA